MNVLRRLKTSLAKSFIGCKKKTDYRLLRTCHQQSLRDRLVHLYTRQQLRGSIQLRHRRIGPNIGHAALDHVEEALAGASLEDNHDDPRHSCAQCSVSKFQAQISRRTRPEFVGRRSSRSHHLLFFITISSSQPYLPLTPVSEATPYQILRLSPLDKISIITREGLALFCFVFLLFCYAFRLLLTYPGGGRGYMYPVLSAALFLSFLFK